MICPECRTEYRDGFYRCSDCDVALVVEAPRYVEPRDPAYPSPAQGNDDLELVVLFETTDPAVAALVQSALEEADIPFLVRNEPIHRLIPAPAAELGPIQFWVAADDETDARSVLDALGRPMTENDEDVESFDE